MKKAIYFIGLAFALLLSVSSCQKAPFLTFNGQKSFTFKDTGGSETITFSCNRAWTAKSSESWITVSPAQGDANEEGARVTITCAANTTYDSRTATVTISSEGLTETISISQDTNYGLLSDPTTFNLTNAAQTIEVEVKANVEYSIAIDDACKDWISQAGTKALSSTKLSFNIAANESYDDREGKITISQKGSSTSVQPQVITVKQSQTNGLFITTPEYALSNESHDLTIEVKANVSYEVTPEVDWIKYEASSTKALSTTTFTLKVDKNETYDQRVGTVKVKGGGLEGIITITQAENLGLFVSPTEVQISKDAQEVEVEVNTNVDYDIVIPEEAKGMITTVKTEGGETKALVAKKVRFGISENTKYEGREASITFKQKGGALCGTIKISQSQNNGLVVDTKEYIIDRTGGNIEIKLKANVKIDAVISDSDKDWISLINNSTKALSDESIFLSISENTTFCQRSASVELCGDGVREVITINQTHADLINVGTPGSLKQLCANIGQDNIKYLALTGTLNNSDFAELCLSFPNLTCLDLSGIANTTLSVGQFQEQATITNYILPNGLTKIPDKCFCNSVAQYVHMPDCVIEIGVEAFKKSRLKEITFPKSLLTIKEGAFALCALLNGDLKFNDNLQSIGSAAFNQCQSINYLAPLPASLKQIEKEAFIYCTRMKGDLIIPDGCSVGVAAFHFCYAIESLSLPDSMEEISDRAFCYLSSIKSIDFPKKLRVIGSGAFAYCSSVTGDLIIPDTVETINESAFRGCTSYDGILVIGSNCKYIGTYESWGTFEGAKFNKIYCKALTPPAVQISGGTYNVGVRKTYLGVPAGTLSLYKNAEYWKDFTYIEEVDFNEL